MFAYIKRDFIKQHWKELLAILLVGIALGYWLTPSPQMALKETTLKTQPQRKIKHWTCSMHPQIKASGPGKCPICGMDLIPIYEDGAETRGEVDLKLGERAQGLAEVATDVVDYRPLTKEIYTVGKIDYDEARVAYVAAWIGGRIDRLYADFTGMHVNKGDHLVSLYSPELMSTQEEYLLALKNVRQSTGSQFKGMAEDTLSSAQDKLLLYGITEEQLKEIRKLGKVQTHLTINAPISGTVIHKKALEGMYVKMGDQIYTIADLSRVWLYLDIYEYDLAWIKYGQLVEVTTEAYPGEALEGRIVFIDPFLNEQTRTVKVRVNVPNPEGALKPGMYANAYIKVKVGPGGQVEVADLTGKYISPMHPEIIRDAPGKCPICGMDLVPVGGVVGMMSSSNPELGIKSSPQGILSVPRSAVLDTGKRKLVYVELEKGKYSPREIKVGPQAGEYYPVIEGLEAGERVVTSGNFLIDSQMQLAGKPSLMFPEGSSIDIHAAMGHGGMSMPGEKQEGDSHNKPAAAPHNHQAAQLKVPPQLIKQIHQLLAAYFIIQQKLSADSIKKIEAAQKELIAILTATEDMTDTLPQAHQGHFRSALARLKQAAEGLGGQDIKHLREWFKGVSQAMIALVGDFYQGQPGTTRVYQLYCPMAPGYWLQAEKDTRNPYYGPSMLKCGELVKDWGGDDKP
jgi:Cu(I)/Ag(I) efflux system membrane fusion protein